MDHDQIPTATPLQVAVEADMRRIVVAFQPVTDAFVDTAQRIVQGPQAARDEAARRG